MVPPCAVFVSSARPERRSIARLRALRRLVSRYAATALGELP